MVTAENDINFLAFVPIELQGNIEKFLIFTTGTTPQFCLFIERLC